MELINENVFELTSGTRSFAEEVYYKYQSIEKKHRFRSIFDPLRILEESKLIHDYKDSQTRFPASVEIDPSNICNHDCPFCIYSSMHKKDGKEHFKEEKLRDIILQLINLNVKSILFIGGGEPLTNPHTPTAISLANQASISTGLVTNGSLITKSNTSILKESCSYIRISLDAGKNVTHEKLHRSKDFYRIIGNINNLSRTNGKATIGVSYFINEYNHNEITDAAKLVKDVGADYIQYKSYAGIALNPSVHNSVLKQIDNAIEISDSRFDVHVSERVFTNSTFQVRGYSKCHWQNFKTIINANGNVYVCAQKRNKKNAVIGNVFDNTLADIWHGSQRLEVLKNLILSECPFCAHHTQNTILEFLSSKNGKHKNFF